MHLDTAAMRGNHCDGIRAEHRPEVGGGRHSEPEAVFDMPWPDLAARYNPRVLAHFLRGAS